MLDDQQQLIDNLQESLHVEVKNWLGGLSENAEKARLAKEIIALANSGGGRIFIGFEDDDGGVHKPILPGPNEEKAFERDGISDLVQRYCTPPIQCKVEYRYQTDENIRHPVILIPGDSRVPTFASHGSPDQKTLVAGQVYVRRPGGSSEPCRDQNDWELLLDRLVRARQGEIVQAVRSVMNPVSDGVASLPEQEFEEWIEKNRNERGMRLEELPEDHPFQFPKGHYEVAFAISNFGQVDLRELHQSLNQDRPIFSGLPPFSFMPELGMGYRPKTDMIQTWVPDNVDESLIEYWCLSVTGQGYSVRPMQEDTPRYSSQYGALVFDWKLAPYRMTEVLKFVEWLGHKHSSKNANFQLRVTYRGMDGRKLVNRSQFILPTHHQSHDETISSEISGLIGGIALNVEELVFNLLKPIYSQFDFATLPRGVVNEVVKEAIRNQR